MLYFCTPRLMIEQKAMKEHVMLDKPPVAMALFQLKYDSSNIVLIDFNKYDSYLKRKFPVRKENVSVGIK